MDALTWSGLPSDYFCRMWKQTCDLVLLVCLYDRTKINLLFFCNMWVKCLEDRIKTHLYPMLFKLNENLDNLL